LMIGHVGPLLDFPQTRFCIQPYHQIL